MTKLQRKLIRICGKRPNRIRGGRARGKSVLDFDPKQLWAGIKVEQEHSPSRRIACEVALDHLTEHQKYYTVLKKARL